MPKSPVWPTTAMPTKASWSDPEPPFYFSLSLRDNPVGGRWSLLDHLLLMGRKPSDAFCRTLARELAVSPHRTMTVAVYDDLNVPTSNIDSEPKLSSITARTITVSDLANVEAFTFSQWHGRLQLGYVCQDMEGHRFVMSEREFHQHFTSHTQHGKNIVDLIYGELATIQGRLDRHPDLSVGDCSALKVPPGLDLMKAHMVDRNPSAMTNVLLKIAEFNDFPFVAKSGAVMSISPETAGRRAAAALNIPELIDTEAELRESQLLNPHFGILKF